MATLGRGSQTPAACDAILAGAVMPPATPEGCVLGLPACLLACLCLPRLPPLWTPAPPPVTFCHGTTIISFLPHPLLCNPLFRPFQHGCRISASHLCMCLTGAS